MADKVLRFTAEDGGYGQTIDRMAAKLRSAFESSGTKTAGIEDLLQEADQKFVNFSDKVRYIKEQLGEIQQSNKGELQEEIGELRKKKTIGLEGRGEARTSVLRKGEEIPAVKEQIEEKTATYEQEEKEIDKLITALDNLTKQVEEENTHRTEGVIGEEGEKKTITDRIKTNLRPDTESKQPSGGVAVGSGLGIGGVIGGVLIGSLLSAVVEKALGAVSAAASQGHQLATTELELNRKFRYTGEIGTDRASEIANLGVKNQEYLDRVGSVAASRRNNGLVDVDTEAFRRLELEKGRGIDPNQIAQLDRVMRLDQNGKINNPTQFDASRTIVELLQRGSRPGGIFDLQKGDFLMASEKIEQVTQILNQQYDRTGTTDPNAAINMIIAGQQIGGRFAGNQAGTAFNNLSRGITDPSSPGMRAYITAALHAAHPDMDQYELQAEMQKGLTSENIKAVLPGLMNTRSKMMREAIFMNLTGGNAADAMALAKTGSMEALLKQAEARGLTKEGIGTAETDIRKKAFGTTLTTDAMVSRVENSVTQFAESVIQFVNGVNKNNTTPEGNPITRSLIDSTKTKNNKVIEAPKK